LPPSSFYPPLTENDSPSINQQRPPPPPPPPPPKPPAVFGPQINSSAQSVFSAGGSTLSPNNLNLLEKDVFQVQNNVVAQFAAEGQGADENSILSPSNTSIQFVDDLDEVAPMSIPVEFRTHSSTTALPETKLPIEVIDSVAPQSVPGKESLSPGPPILTNYYHPYNNQYKFQMSSDGNPVQSFKSPSAFNKESFWNSEEQLEYANLYGPSIQLHPKWPNLHYYPPEIDQSTSANGYNSYTIIPPSLPQSFIAPFIQQTQVQGPFAPERKKPESYNEVQEISLEIKSNTTLTLNNSLIDVKNSTTSSHEQQVTMHHLSSDGELTILKVGPKEDSSNKNEISDDDTNLVNNNSNESDFNEIETEADHRIDNNDDDPDEDIDDDADLHSDFSDSLDSPDPKSDTTKYIILQKLPNGGAIDLENMQTYTMEDFASDIQQNNKQNNLTYDRPRSFQKSLENPSKSDEKMFNNFTEIEEETTLEPFSDISLPPKLLISERPPTLPEIYEPLPLSQLDDQEAMSSSQDDHPVYIIYEKDLFQGQEEQTIAESLSNLELFKISSNSTTETQVNTGNSTLYAFNTDEEQLDDNQLEENNYNNGKGILETPKIEWTPIPIQDLRTTLTKPSNQVIVPDWPPTKIGKQDSRIDQADTSLLSNAAYVTLEDTTEQKNETQDVKNIQLLPQRLSAVLTNVNNQNRLRSLSVQSSIRQTTGLNRENKIAPIFKYEIPSTDTSHARALPQQQLRSSSPPPTQTSSTRSAVRPGILPKRVCKLDYYKLIQLVHRSKYILTNFVILRQAFWKFGKC
jgi:hypothetical protein